MPIKETGLKIWDFIKKAGIKIGRFYTPHKGRNNIVIYAIKILITIYVVGGIVFSIGIYKFHWENKPMTMVAVKIYPFPAAFVDGKVIWVKDFYKQEHYVKHFLDQTKQKGPDEATLRRQLLDRMVELQIVQTQASKNHIFASKKEIDDAYKKVVDESGGEAEVEKVLEELYGMNKKDFLQLVKEQVIKDKVREGLLVQIKARHILVRDDARAKEALDKVKAGGNFEDLAKEYSEDTASRDKGGDLGWFGRGTMVKEFEDAAFKLKPGETSELVKTEYGNHIIRVEDRKGKIDKSYDDWINEVRDKAKIIKFIR